jgi:DNA-binding transcriptional LysR family regulator
MRLQLRHLAHAVTLADEGNYTVAARKLSLSQPALSRSIQVLEEILGSPLFDRLGGAVKPTYIGQMVVDRGRAILGSTAEVEREVQLALGLEIGALTIGVGPYPAEISVGLACGRFSRQHPLIKLEVRVRDWPKLVPMVLDGEVDMAIAELSTTVGNSQLETEALPKHFAQFICRVGHPLARRSEISLEDTRQFPLATSSLPARFGNLRPSIRVDTYQLIRDIVLNSNTLGLAANCQTIEDVKQGLLVRLPMLLPWAHSNYGFIRLKGRTPSPAKRAFMDIVREVEAEITQAEALGSK